MYFKHTKEQQWISAGYDGAERAVLRMSASNGRTAVVRIKAGAQGPRHRHQAGEDVLVISGKINLGGTVMGPGDYAWTEAGEEHALTAIEDSVIYVASDQPITLVAT